MDPAIPPDPSFLELAHVMPGRIRLRWRGSGAPPPAELLERLRAGDGIEAVAYRPASRSLLIEHRNGFNVEQLRRLAGEASVPVREPPPPPSLRESGEAARTEPGPHADFVATVEALVLIGLMYTWVRDMVVTRTFRVGTVLLLLLTGLSLFRRWQKRVRESRSAAAVEQPRELQAS